MTSSSDYSSNLKRIAQGASMIVDAIGQIGVGIGTNIGRALNEKNDGKQEKRYTKDSAAHQVQIKPDARKNASAASNKEIEQKDPDKS